MESETLNRKAMLAGVAIIVGTAVAILTRTGASPGQPSESSPALEDTATVRRSSAIIYPDDTPDPHAVSVTDIPGEPTPYWLFDEALAVQKVQEITGTSDWLSYVARRTTATQIDYLLSDRSEPLPSLEEDRSEPQWIVAWETSELMSRGQIERALSFLAYQEDESEFVGNRALIVLNEGANPVTVSFLNQQDSDGTIREFPPRFQDIRDLPVVPGSISR